MANTEPNDPRNGGVVPDFFNKGESQNATQMISAALSQNASQMIYAALVSVPVTLVALNMMPDLDFLYRSIVILYRIIEKKKWAVHTAFMGLYVFAAVLIRSMTWPDKMLFGDKLLPFWGKAGPALEPAALESLYPLATLVFSQFVFAGITTILLAGALLGSMNFKAWMGFVPLWLSFSYTVGVFSLWGGGFLFQCGVIDFAGGYVIHLSSGVAGFTAAYWVGPRLQKDRERFPPNNVLLMLTGAGFLWLGWCGFNGGAPYAANLVSSMAVLNTNICAATSLLVWTCLDVIFFKKPSVIGAVQGMITGLVCITPGAGVVQGWAAIVMGVLSGSIPWFTMMIVHKKSAFLQKVDDTLAVLHTHAVAGLLGGALTGLFAEPTLCGLFLAVTNSKGAFYGDGMQFVKQIVAAAFVIGWNIVVTSIIMVFIRLFIPLRMPEEHLLIGDDAVHGEEAYALWGDGEKYDDTKHGLTSDETQRDKRDGATALGLTIEL